jgi:hypothetical protein
MTEFSRRQFGTIVIAGVPLAAVSRFNLTAAGAVTLGVSTSSFRDLARIPGRDNLSDVMRALAAVRATRIELALANIEPAPPSTSPTVGGTPAYPQLIVLTPEQIAFVKQQYRIDLRRWRTAGSLYSFEKARETIGTAGMAVHAVAVDYDDSSTDEEIEATLRQVGALGVKTVSSAMTMKMAARLAPIAERHGVSVAIHNQVDGNTGGAIATPDLKKALALSPAFSLKLDIGNLTASNCDAVAVLREHQPRVSYVLVKDRLRNGGTSQHFGEGDTPIAGVFDVLRSSAPAIPAIVECDYVGLHTSVEEVNASVAYLTKLA